MPIRKTPLITDQIYHIVNRGLDKRPIYKSRGDYQRFLNLMTFYQREEKLPSFSRLSKEEITKIIESPPKKRLVEIICYCLMPTHFHILLKQTTEGGISRYIRLISDSYTRYFNLKNQRKGPICEGSFKSVLVEDENQLLHLSRYIHLNPVSSFVVKNLEDYPWTSYFNFIRPNPQSLIPCQRNLILCYFKSVKEYEKFVLDHQDYAQQLERIKHLLQE